jgi:hypothetical protein
MPRTLGGAGAGVAVGSRTRNHATYKAGRNTRVSRVATARRLGWPTAWTGRSRRAQLARDKRASMARFRPATTILLAAAVVS